MAIVRRLRDGGHTAYFAGGCVRDELLGLNPTDYDVATDATPDRIRSFFKRTQEVGAAFGVVLVTPTRDEGAEVPATVEVATFRSDGPYSDRRRPDAVTFSDPRSDAQRRDFTINALFLDPLGAPPPRGHGHRIHPSGAIIDFIGGLPDLERRLLRAVGNADQRLAEDHLRALRAVRFTARLGFELESGTAAAIKAHARELAGVSRERIGEELRKMLAHPSRARATQLLESLELDAPVLDEPHRLTQGGSRSTLGAASDGLPLALAAWALDRTLNPGDHSARRALVSRWRAALCLSNDERGALDDILENLGALEGDWLNWPIARQKRLAGAPSPAFAGAQRLLEARNPARAAAVAEQVETLARTPSGLRPAPLVTGDDLVAMGYPPGPRFKGILDGVYDAQLEGRVGGREEAIGLARELAGGSGV